MTSLVQTPNFSVGRSMEVKEIDLYSQALEEGGITHSGGQTEVT